MNEFMSCQLQCQPSVDVRRVPPRIVTHPNIHEYLLNPLLPLQDNCRTLPVILIKVAADVEHRMNSIPNFQVRLMIEHLMGMSTNVRSMEDEPFLSGTIVLEEFCKELAAIVFVKYHEATPQM
ncbi:hypothetical protein LSAT2_033066 [Lamellibrachia satsuma]|nr:hypothetical protein LSAT2_033066 [Lamellibrachia satsuma]